MRSRAAGKAMPGDLPRLKRSILFVCTGNTCRSPLAEALCKMALARKLNCKESELFDRGFVVRSAGVMAFPGGDASLESIDIAREYGADLTLHRSQPVHPELLEQSTDVLAMTAAHAALLMVQYPNIGPEPQLLCGRDDLPDPIGGNEEIYRACAATIMTHLDRHIVEWLKP